MRLSLRIYDACKALGGQEWWSPRSVKKWKLKCGVKVDMLTMSQSIQSSAYRRLLGLVFMAKLGLEK